MKILQLSDLHLGRRLKEFSLAEDQKFVLDQAVSLMKSGEYAALFLCGDIYDSTVPTAGATSLFDSFLSELHAARKPVFIISGNHDSADKLHFGSSIFKEEGINIVTEVKDALLPVHLGPVDVYLLPFIRPLDVNAAFSQEFKTYTEAISYVIAQMKLDPSRINLLLAHQMVLPASGKLVLGGSEDISAGQDGIAIGDIDAVSASVFSPFAYVALGHVHKPQNVASNARYAGSIYKYHRNEAGNEKSFTVIDIEGKNVRTETIPIRFLHDVIKLEGTLDEIMKSEADPNAFVFASLKDKSLLDDPMAKLRTKYPNAAWIDYADREVIAPSLEKSDMENLSKEDLFLRFYQQQNGSEASADQKTLVHELLSSKEEG